MSIAAVLHGGPLLALRRCNLLLSCLRRGLAIDVHLASLASATLPPRSSGTGCQWSRPAGSIATGCWYWLQAVLHVAPRLAVGGSPCAWPRH